MTHPPRIIGLGEFLYDVFPDSRRPGGAPANVAFHAGQLGAEGVVCTRVGEDVDGDALIGYLAAHGLGTASVQRDPHRPTGTVTVHLERRDGPAYTIHEEVAWDYLEPQPEWEALFGGAAAVCFGTLAQRAPQSRAAIAHALDLAPDALKVYDINLRPPHYSRGLIEESLRRCDIAKLNGDEAHELLGLLQLPGSTLEDFARGVHERFGVGRICITRGADGCVLFGETHADVPGAPVEVVDAVGAGDAFTAALTYGTLAGWPLETVGRFANSVGGLVAGSAGAMPDLRGAFAALKVELD